jgi:hypothetical protein
MNQVKTVDADQGVEKSWALSVLYIVGRFILGLLLHPYQSMQILLEEKVFVWLTLTPAMLLAIITLAWRGLFLPGLSAIFNLSAWAELSLDFGLKPTLFGLEPGLGFVPLGLLELNLTVKDLVSFISTWLILFLLNWQVLLMYLLVRFKLAWQE